MAIYLGDKLVSGDTNSLPVSGGAMSGTINMSGNGITNLKPPINDLDAATKSYIDSQISQISQQLSHEIVNSLSNYLALSGGTMSGVINMGARKIQGLATPTLNTDAATKAYVDSKITTGNYLPLSGGTMSGAISMGSNKITNLLAPTANTDAANKIYVDAVRNLVEALGASVEVIQYSGSAQITSNTSQAIVHSTNHPTAAIVFPIGNDLFQTNSGSYQVIYYIGACADTTQFGGCYFSASTLRVRNYTSGNIAYRLNEQGVKYCAIVFGDA